MTKIPGKGIQDELPKLKKMVEKSQSYFSHNYKRFNEFRKFIYKTSISEREKSVNEELSRPNIEVNVCTAYLSRLCGEFSKQEPSIEVSMDEGAQYVPELIPAIEGHIRHIFDDAKKSNTQYHTYRDSLSGGYGVMKYYSEYANPNSFKQVLKVRKSKYPTLCGFDPLATEPHKGDGNYDFELYPKTKQEFKEEYPHIDIDEIKFAGSSELGGFTWSFNNEVDDILLICDLHLKKKRRVKIVELPDGKVMEEKEYKKMIADIQMAGDIVEPPIAAQSRWTQKVKICKYVFIENKVLDYEETIYEELPLVFDDGDSIDLYDNSKGSIEQFTRPYVYNARGAQQLKNLGAQCLAGYLENISQHKYLVKREAIPLEKEYLNALTEPQKANTLVVNAFMDDDPTKPIMEPLVPLQPQACPPEISNAISMADQIIQSELGSYDAALGINDNQLSGIAIVEAATQSNAAAMPFVVNYISCLNQIANGIIKVIPKLYKTPMTIPVIDKEGNRSAIKINQEGGIDFNYDSNLLQVKVTAGVNFAIQKSRALQQIIALCQASPGFAKFMEEKGLKVLVDNIEVRGSDILKELADEYLKEVEAQKAKQQAMQEKMMQDNPALMDQKTKAFTAQANAALKEKELQIKEEELEIKKETAKAQHDATIARANAEEVRANMDIRMKQMDMHHRHGKDTVELAHKIHSSEKEKSHER